MNNICVFLTFVLALGLAEAVLQIDNESELREAQAALFNPGSTSGWCLLNYVGPHTVHFAAGGEGTAPDVVDNLQDDQIQYMVIRVPVEGNYRDVFICWIGKNVGKLEKDEKAGDHGDAEGLLQPFHSSCVAGEREAFTDEKIIDRSSPLSGSHVIE